MLCLSGTGVVHVRIVYIEIAAVLPFNQRSDETSERADQVRIVPVSGNDLL